MYIVSYKKSLAKHYIQIAKRTSNTHFRKTISSVRLKSVPTATTLI